MSKKVKKGIVPEIVKKVLDIKPIEPVTPPEVIKPVTRDLVAEIELLKKRLDVLERLFGIVR